jgi:hypothetical protein
MIVYHGDTMKHIATILLTLALTACQGPVGPVGAPGQDGTDGAVNATTVTFKLPATGFSQNVGAEGFTHPVPEITESVARYGQVIAYTDLSTGRTDQWFAMPLLLPIPNAAVTLTYAYNTGSITILVQAESGTGWSSIFAGQTIKVVIIPPAS